jgi:3-dehydroquinate synthase
MSARVEVAGPDAAYTVHVERGAIAALPALLQSAVTAHAWAVIADHTVAVLHGGRVRDTLRDAGIDARLFTFPAGERHKTRAEWAVLSDAMIDAGIGRDGAVLALGGGVTTDLAGFVAATYLRGVPLVLAPSSLLAMVDAAIGGKTGVDVPGGKNLVGAFHQPRLVVVDPDLLDTLPDAVFAEGLAEAVKHAAIADVAQLDELEHDAARVLARASDAVEALVRRSVAIKAGFVSADPLEGGRRALLNFGHTIAHAIERVTDYAVPHGHAVAIGVVAEAAIGEAAGITAPGTARRLATVLDALGLPTAPPDGCDADALLDAAAGDKKARAGVLRYALIARIGVPARAADGGWTHAIDASIASVALASTAHRASPGHPSRGPDDGRVVV